MAKGKRVEDKKNKKRKRPTNEIVSGDPYLWVHPNVKKEASLYDDQESTTYSNQSARLLANGDEAIFKCFPYSPQD